MYRVTKEKRKSDFVLFIVLNLLVIFFVTQKGLSQGTQYLEIIVKPYLQHSTQTTMAIMWETNLHANSMVEFGEKLPLTSYVNENKPKTIHELILTELKPETNYFYRVISKDKNNDVAASEIYTFKTAVREIAAFAFVVLGDSRTYPARFEKIAKLAYAERPNFVLHVGDVVNNGKKKHEWALEYLNPASVLMSRIPTYVAIGNHERNARWYYEYSCYPEPENYYSFKYGNAEFFIVDTNEKLKPASKQMKWLNKVLAASSAKWKFVAHHHPPYSSDENDYGDTYREHSTLGDLKVRKLVSLYEKYHVDIVWVGHIHTYERSWPIKNNEVNQEEGVIYIQAGGGGAELEDFAPTRTWFAAKLLRNWQYCFVNIHKGTLQMMAYDINGQMYDFLELKK
jgi:acid phosphatase type 7